MRKALFLSILFYAIACNSPENKSANSDSILNTPPGFTTDTSGGSRIDTSHVKDSLNQGAGGAGTGRTGPDSKQ